MFGKSFRGQRTFIGQDTLSREKQAEYSYKLARALADAAEIISFARANPDISRSSGLDADAVKIAAITEGSRELWANILSDLERGAASGAVHLADIDELVALVEPAKAKLMAAKSPSLLTVGILLGGAAFIASEALGLTNFLGLKKKGR